MATKWLQCEELFKMFSILIGMYRCSKASKVKWSFMHGIYQGTSMPDKSGNDWLKKLCSKQPTSLSIVSIIEMTNVHLRMQIKGCQLTLKDRRKTKNKEMKLEPRWRKNAKSLSQWDLNSLSPRTDLQMVYQLKLWMYQTKQKQAMGLEQPR